MIKNFEIASSYVSALDIQEGVEHWRNELCAAAPGEVVYSGNVGGAVMPLQLRGFPPSADLPNVRALYERLQSLGDPIAFAPSSSLVTNQRWRCSDIPALQAFRMNGKASVSISLLLNSAAISAEWVQPPAREKLSLQEIRDLRISLPNLALQSDVFEFQCRVSGVWSRKDWLVTVAINRSESAEPILSATFRYAPRPLLLRSYRLDHSGPVEQLEMNGPCTWDGRLFRAIRWRQNGVTPLKASLPDWRDSDLWANALCPRAHLPIPALEAVWQAATARSVEPPTRLKAQSILFFEGEAPNYLVYSPHHAGWDAVDANNHLCFEALGVEAHG